MFAIDKLDVSLDIGENPIQCCVPCDFSQMFPFLAPNNYEIDQCLDQQKVQQKINSQ